MQKVPGVTAVKVSLNDGLTILDFAQDNTVTLVRLRQVIRNNGFVTNESRIVARGSVTTSGGASVFEVSGSKERLTLTGSSQSSRSNVVVEGTVNMKDPKRMTLSAR
jgi:hypothetical protein